MKEWLSTWYNRYACLTLFVVIGFVGYNGIGWSGLTASDWATWTGAIFAGLAFCGTIWLATAETRRRERAEYLKAVVVAAGLAPRIERISFDLHTFIVGLHFTNIETGKHDTPSQEASMFREMHHFSVPMDEMVILVALGDNCASRLAHAITLLNLAREEISHYVGRTIHLHEPLPEHVAEEWARWISEPHRLLEMVRRQCSDAASIYAPQPSSSEFWGD